MKKIIIIGMLIVVGIGSIYFIHYEFLQNEVRSLSMRPFVADMAVIYSDGLKRKIGRDYSGYNKWKVGTEKYYVIFRGDKGVMWTVISPNTYLESSFRQMKGMPQRMLDFSRFPRKGYIGTTVVDGQKAYEFIKIKNWSIQVLFISQKDLVPIKVDIYHGLSRKVVMTFENVQIGEPPASVFDIPSGYQKMEVSIEELKKIRDRIKFGAQGRLNEKNY